jgi:hypothetical protein
MSFRHLLVRAARHFQQSLGAPPADAAATSRAIGSANGPSRPSWSRLATPISALFSTAAKERTGQTLQRQPAASSTGAAAEGSSSSNTPRVQAQPAAAAAPDTKPLKVAARLLRASPAPSPALASVPPAATLLPKRNSSSPPPADRPSSSYRGVTWSKSEQKWRAALPYMDALTGTRKLRLLG